MLLEDSDVTFLSTVTATFIQSMGGDHMIVAAAKVSTDPEEALKYALEEEAGGSAGLINYLMKQRHGSPFEHNGITFFVHAPLFVFREWQRHRIASYNEFSGRYSAMLPEFWIPNPVRNMVPVKGFKPARPVFCPPSIEQYNDLVVDIQAENKQDWKAYQARLDKGIAKEVARATIPLNIYSRMWVTSNLRAWMNFLSLRTHDPAATYVSYPMWEINDGANQVEEVLTTLFPIAMQAFNDNGRVAP